MQYAGILAATDSDAVQSAWAAQRCGNDQRMDAATRLAAATLVRDSCGQWLSMMAAGDNQVEKQDAPMLERLVAEVRTRERRILERAKVLLTQERSQLRSLTSG